MEKENRRPERKEDPYHINEEYSLDTDACTECTGLMYRAPEGREEWDAYREVYDFTPVPPQREDRRQPSHPPDAR